MKKLLLILFTGTCVASPVVALQKQPQKAEQSSAAKRFAIFIRDTAIGAVLGLGMGFLWHLDGERRNNNGQNAPHNPPPYDGTEGAPNPPGGPAIAPVGNANNNYDRIITGLIVGAIGGALIGTAEVANDVVGANDPMTTPQERSQIESDAALARQILKEEQAQFKAGRKV